MTEQQNGPARPRTPEESPEEVAGGTGERPGEVRTHGETAVDEALGTGDDVR